MLKNTKKKFFKRMDFIYLKIELYLQTFFLQDRRAWWNW